MGVLDRERPLASTPLVGCKACVTAVYPVGHTGNASGQTVCDVLPSGGLPTMYRVPIAHGHAHEETETAAPLTPRRNPNDPKPRNRMQGSSFDVRPGTFVWVTFLGGSIFSPVITATLGYDQKTKGDEPGVYAPSVDTIGEDGSVTAETRTPFDSHMRDYPRRVESYNGCRDEVDNTGSRYIQTSTDREPVFKAHNDIEDSPTPAGNYGVSTRGSVVGNIRFTTGRAPASDGNGGVQARSGDDEAHVGRMERVAIQADDGTIRDETDSKVGAIVHKSSGIAWTKGASVYMEGNRAYLKLTGDADVYGDTGVMNNGTVKLGGPGMSDEIVLWPQLCQVLDAVFKAIDAHIHDGVTSGPDTTGNPVTPVSPIFDGGKDSFKAADVLAGQSASPSASHAGDPDDKRKDKAT
jgi:hypothetical protein